MTDRQRLERLEDRVEQLVTLVAGMVKAPQACALLLEHEQPPRLRYPDGSEIELDTSLALRVEGVLWVMPTVDGGSELRARRIEVLG